MVNKLGNDTIAHYGLQDYRTSMNTTKDNPHPVRTASRSQKALLNSTRSRQLNYSSVRSIGESRTSVEAHPTGLSSTDLLNELE